jgi:hypothetical protein
LHWLVLLLCFRCALFRLRSHPNASQIYLVFRKQDQQAFIENLALRYNKFSTEVGEFMSGVGATITNVESSCRDTQFQLKELKDYVDHFADNLVLSSGQITVETDAGFNVKPMSLTETLKGARGTLTELETGAEKTTEKIEQIVTDLDTKAPDTVLFNVSTLERKVSTIEVHLRKEEEQGIGVSERACAWVLLNRLRYFAWHGRESPLRDYFLCCV